MSDLEEVIAAYEEEKAALEQQIAEYVEEADYFYAHHHQRALKRINTRLYILKNLQNPNHGKIVREEQSIAGLTKIREQPRLKILGEAYFERRIEEHNHKIQELKTETFEPNYDSQEIDDVLFELSEGRINGFKLFFKSSSDIYLDFSRDTQGIVIRLSWDKLLEYNTQHMSIYATQLEVLEFELVDKHWTYRHTGHFKDALEIKIMLARLIYDVFHYDRYYDKAKIVIK